ncbi:MAG: hypothetical protein JO284_18295 [Planctomycetaceae bacterium]|nr:hypothetical protein [Planctomycetaceae bacterium]
MLPDQFAELQRAVDRLNTIVTIVGSVASLFAVMIVGGIAWSIATLSRLDAQVAALLQRFDRLEKRLDDFELGGGPFGQQLKRLQEQVDALQKRGA